MEPGTLQYDIFFNDDQSRAVVIERFQDSDALIEHGANMADISARGPRHGRWQGELLGEPNAESTERLAGSEPTPPLHAPSRM